jgi:hypothetical protein
VKDQKHKTSINYTRLPIFAGSRSIKKNKPYEISYKDNRGKYWLKIENGMLSSYERKVFLTLEYLYLQQNPSFERDYVRVNLSKIQETMGTKGNSRDNILKAIQNLQKVNITSTLTYKKGELVEVEEGVQFSLLPRVKWKTKRSYTDSEKYNVRKYTGYIDIGFQPFHIENLKSNYYRLINFSLVKKLTNKSVRLYDYINLNAYHKDGDTYKQFQNLTINYKNLCKFLIIKEFPSVSQVERQLGKQLEELVELGVIKSYTIEKDFFDIVIYLILSPSINLWSKHTPQSVDNIEKETPLQHSLLSYIPPPQVKYLINNFPEEHIEEKLNQFLYLKRYHSYKIKGEASYLYNSIKKDWVDDFYKEYKEKKEERDKRTDITKKNRENDLLEIEYEKYIVDRCMKFYKRLPVENRLIIDKEIENIIENKKFFTEFQRSLYIDNKIVEIVKDRVNLPSFIEWKVK